MNMFYAICFTNLHAPDLAPPLRTCCRYFPSLLTSAGSPNFLAKMDSRQTCSKMDSRQTCSSAFHVAGH